MFSTAVWGSVFFSGAPLVKMELRIAVVCSSNQNRSMEAHHFLRYFTNENCFENIPDLTLFSLPNRHKSYFIYYIVSLLLFSKKGFNVKSFGTGTHVKLPGLAQDRPNVYEFSTTYDEMYKDLLNKDRQM